ncbi:MAG: hypothetical protein Q9227_005328 [Pyrenula ochraceoflavens]
MIQHDLNHGPARQISQNPKFSRYRAVRLPDGPIQTAPPAGDLEALPPVQNDTISRSRSRYHRKPSKQSPLTNPPPKGPPRPKPEVVPQSHPPALSALKGEICNISDEEDLPFCPKQSETIPSREPLGKEHETHDQQRGPAPVTYLSHGQNGFQNGKRLQKRRKDGYDPSRAQQEAHEILDAEEERMQRQKCRFAGKHNRPYPRKADAAAVNMDKDDENQPLRERLSRSPTKRMPGQVGRLSSPPRVQKDAITGSLFPGTDAPISAVNAGERKVTVKWYKLSIDLPVTPSTTSFSLLKSASQLLSGDIDPGVSVLMECYSKLGLERILRNYEHIRDVMNSWDADADNHLRIAPKTLESAASLELKGAPSEQPEASIIMQHSMRPGKWEKRLVALRSDGQISVAKKEGDTPLNICHLSDFDVYSPTRQQLSKLRPPKKHCLAVKSQQKSTMFMSGENFVHFFATGDKALASTWHNTIQDWRSWYLINVLGAGQPSAQQNSLHRSQSRRRSIDSLTHQANISRHAGGLSDSETQKRPTTAPGNEPITGAFHRRKQSTTTRVPPSSFPKSFPDIESNPNPPDAFTPNSLLASVQSQGQPTSSDAQRGSSSSHQRSRSRSRTRSNSLTSTSAPILSGLPANPAAPPTISATMKRTPSLRSSSRRQPAPIPAAPHQQPLVDLTPKYQEPPQHARKGRGVAAEPGKQLIDLATGIEREPGAIEVPSATTWRRPSALAGGESAGIGIGHRRGRGSVDAGVGVGRRSMSRDRGPGSVGEETGFTGGGLLARGRR